MGYENGAFPHVSGTSFNHYGERGVVSHQGLSATAEGIFYLRGDVNTEGSIRESSPAGENYTYYQQLLDGEWTTIATRGGSMSTDALYLWDKALIRATDIHVSEKERDMIGWNRALDVVFIGDSAEGVDVDIIGTPYSSKMNPDHPFAWVVKQSDMSTRYTGETTTFPITAQTYPSGHIGVVIAARLQLDNVPEGTRARIVVRDMTDESHPIVFRSDPDVNWKRGSGAVVSDGLCDIPITPPFPTKSETAYQVEIEFSDTVDYFGDDGAHGPASPYIEVNMGLNRRSEIVTTDVLRHQEVDGDMRLRDAGMYMVDTTAQAVELDLQDIADFGALRRLSVVDAFGQFNTNNCSLLYNGDTYVMNKDNKQYDFFINGDGTMRWTESDREMK